MHEKERHRIILSAIQDRPVATVGEICDLTGASEATIRRDIATLHLEQSYAVYAVAPKRCRRRNLAALPAGHSR